MVYPKLRFTNDNGGYKDWKIKPFNKVFTTISSNSYAREKLNYKHGNVYNIHYGDVLIKYGANLDVKTTVIPLITNENDASKAVAKGTLVTGDIVIADAAEDETAGKATEIVNQSDEQIVAGLHTIACKPKEGLFEPGFLGYYLNSPAYHNQIFKLLRITKVLSINHKDIIETTISVPDKEEQQKIADFLSDVDNQIEHYQLSLDNLESQKKELLRQVFSQELRFTKDDGSNYPDWEDDKLGNFCDTFSGGTPLTTHKEYYGGNIPFIKSGEINNPAMSTTITKLGFDNSSAKMVDVGDLLYAIYGATAGECALSKVKGAINQAVLCIRTHGVNTSYLLYWLRQYKLSILKYKSGLQDNLSAKTIKALTVNYPCPEEQQRIADFFSDFDNRIELERQRLQTMQEVKKGLLQQMFC